MKIDLTKTQLGILEVLSDRWYEFVNVSNISPYADLSISSVYGSITSLKERNIVMELNRAYKINFSNDIAWAVKRLHDASKLYSLPNHIQHKIVEIREKANLFFTNGIRAIFVFGSSASLEIKKESDVDFFLILQKKKPNFLNFLTSEDKNFNFIQNELSEFYEGYENGNDFILAILKNHILLQGDDIIRILLERDLPIVSKKVIHEREVQLNELKNKIDKLIFEDHPIAYEKTKEFIKSKVRLMLMKSNVVPVSNRNLFDIMKKQFPKYYESHKNLSRKNTRDTYLKLVRD